MYRHLLGREAPRESLSGDKQRGTVTSCRKIQVLEGFLEEAVFELSLEGWGENLLGRGVGTCVLGGESCPS